MVVINHIENNITSTVKTAPPTQAEQSKPEVKRGRKPKDAE